MGTAHNDLGMIEVHLHKITNMLIPHALTLKTKVDKGSRLNDFDIEFLEEVFEYHRTVMRDFEKHPEYEHLIIQLSMLYTHIVELGTDNLAVK
ncbi:MAG: hypothetical protein ACI9Y1_001031 [Lentisphaeria bacterium]|jgi:hypothetical protein